MALSSAKNAILIQLLHYSKADTPQFFDQYTLYLLYDHSADINYCNIVTLSHCTVINYLKYSPEC